MALQGPTPPPPPEAQLVAAAQAGDQAAFGALVRTSVPSLERLALRIVGNRHDAEDVAQDAVLAAWRRVDQFQGRSRFATWLCRIVVRRALDLVRRRREPPTPPPAAARPTPAEAVASRDFEERVRAAIDELPPVQRATLLLRVDQQLSYEEIAYVLGSTRNAVRMNLIAGRKRMAILLADLVDGPGPRGGVA